MEVLDRFRFAASLAALDPNPLEEGRVGAQVTH